MTFVNKYECTHDVDVIQDGPENAYEQKYKEYPRIDNASSQCRTQQYVKEVDCQIDNHFFSVVYEAI